MANRRVPPITIRNAQILFKNFGGRPDKYHPKGGDNRSFCVLIPISAPRPNWAPSVKLVGAFQYTQAAST